MHSLNYAIVIAKRYTVLQVNHLKCVVLPHLMCVLLLHICLLVILTREAKQPNGVHRRHLHSTNALASTLEIISRWELLSHQLEHK
jgi:hypothetical protein